MYEKIVKENGFQDVENVGLEWVSKILKISMKSWGFQREVDRDLASQRLERLTTLGLQSVKACRFCRYNKRM